MEKKRGRGGSEKRKYLLNDEEMNYFLETYDGSSAAVDKLQDRLHWPRYAIVNLAVVSGLTRPKERPWSADEISYLYAHKDGLSVHQIAANLHRSRMSVRIKMMRLPDTDGLYTQCQLCHFLGCSHHDVQRWIDSSYLSATRRDVNGNPDDREWLLSRESIREFLLSHLYEIKSPARVDVHWLIKLLV